MASTIRPTVMTFEEFKKAKGFPSEPVYVPCDPTEDKFKDSKPAKVLKEWARVFIKSIVGDLQNYHNRGCCVQAINSKTIKIVGNVALLDGGVTKFTEDEAKKNYVDVAVFIEDEILNGKDMPHSLTNFLELLKDKPRENIDFIKSHYGILPTHLRTAFISHCILAMGGLKGTLGSDHETTLKNLPPTFDWATFLPTSGPLREICNSFLHGPHNSYDLLDYHSYVVDHIGVREIPMFVKDDNYTSWFNALSTGEQESVELMISLNYSTTSVDPDMKLGEAVTLLESLFPKFLTSVQGTLHSKGMLKDLGINF